MEERAWACAVFRVGGPAAGRQAHGPDGRSGVYALPLHAVVEVGRVPQLTRVPGTVPPLAGVANWRGRVLAVLDVGPLLGAEPARPARGTRLLVCQLGPSGRLGGAELGLLAESVLAVSGEPLRLAPPLSSLPAERAALLAGQAETEHGLVGVLDPDALAALAPTVVAAA